MRRFESDVENAAQDHAEVQIGAMTWYQGNQSMPDVPRQRNEDSFGIMGPRIGPPRRREECSRQ